MFRLFDSLPQVNPIRLMTHKFTEMSNYLIDWSRALELFLSNHHYSKKELLVRGCVAGFGAMSGLLTYLTNDPNKTGISTGIFVICNTLLGTFIAHNAVVYPLYEKRKQIKNACYELIREMKEGFYLNDLNSNEKLKNIMNAIMSVSLANEKHDQATLTWSCRLHLLQNLQLFLIHSNHEERQIFMAKDLHSLLQDLSTMQIYNEDNKIDLSLHANAIKPKI